MRTMMLFVWLLGGALLARGTRAEEYLPPPVVLSGPQPGGADVRQGYEAWNPLRPPPHLVLRRHAEPQPPAVFDAPRPREAPALQARERELTHQHSIKKDKAYVTGRRPPLPEATTELRQKTPYSYGYFGAIEKRHWSMHFGSRQSFTRWSQR